MSKKNKQKYDVIFTVMHQAYVYILPSTVTKQLLLASYSFKMVYIGGTNLESSVIKKKKRNPLLFTKENMCVSVETARQESKGKLSIPHYAETFLPVCPCSC